LDMALKCLTQVGKCDKVRASGNSLDMGRKFEKIGAPFHADRPDLRRSCVGRIHSSLAGDQMFLRDLSVRLLEGGR
jgi:hypothetical protein